MVDCKKCVNRGSVNGLSQETFCDGCIHYGASWKKDYFKVKEEMPHPLPFHFTTLAEIEHKEKHQNDSFKKWMNSGEFRFLHDRNRVELEDYMRGCFSVMADLQAEILRLKQM